MQTKQGASGALFFWLVQRTGCRRYREHSALLKCNRNADAAVPSLLQLAPGGRMAAGAVVQDRQRQMKFSVEYSQNRGYGVNQKTCYQMALARAADIVAMLHPDYQYPPKLVPAMVSIIANDNADVVLISRILGGGALAGGMPLYKYIANRIPTTVQNVLLARNLSGYHTGYRAWSRRVLETLLLAQQLR